ncbi:universal stress protein [Planosporangium thailandense]|uniref:Universal stress protein n=1 Tax=Planosporangium thailandense TaxID=765197 RepID=A0ABX0Y6Y8_9ACTN|nr:universal stress protein [Planosporangium thailandense]NJC73315.1 universal stress protein [Planosporangium thailandense]
MNAQRIVVGVDGSQESRRALAWAAAEAAACDGRLLVYRVYPAGLPSPAAGRSRTPARSATAVVELADPALAQALSSVRARLGGDRIEVATPTGDPGQRLLGAGGDLLVVGAPRSRAILPRVALPRPSVARSVAAGARCPVVVARPAAGTRGLFAGHVVVGVDGGTGARAALCFGFAYAARHGLPLAAVHAVGPHHETAPGDVWVDDRYAETHLAPPPAALTLLDEEVEPYTREHPEVAVKRAVHRGGAVPALRRAAAGAGLLVVGARSHGAATTLTGSTGLGAVGQAMVTHGVGPVAVVHEPDG